MIIRFGIDGTGPILDSRYEKGFSRSFVRRICQGPGEYCRGPGPLGRGLNTSILDGEQRILQACRSYRQVDVMLTGFSRGGLGVLVLAERLRRAGIAVKALLLLDAVDRHLRFNAGTVPDNVEFVMHARRDPATNSRNSFGNCGTRAANPAATRYMERLYPGTHAAMGGVPFTPGKGRTMNDLVREDALESIYNHSPGFRTNVTYARDLQASNTVWTDAQGFLHKYGFA